MNSARKRLSKFGNRRGGILAVLKGFRLKVLGTTRIIVSTPKTAFSWNHHRHDSYEAILRPKLLLLAAHSTSNIIQLSVVAPNRVSLDILVAIYLWLFMHVAFRHQLKSIFESKSSEQLTSISDAPIQSLFLLLRNSNSSVLSVLVITILKFQSLSTVKSNFRFWLHDI